ncbi:MAG: deoxyribonuclease IV [Syntrophomonadaceae bacterium]|nr:deoxyribonuclease IV [Syntrophomonadaceae bacterium]
MMKKHVLSPKLGAHLSIGKGLEATARNAVEMEVETFQIFLRNPRGSKSRTWSVNEIEAFRDITVSNGITPIVAHIPYIVNPASGKDDLYQLAERVISEDLVRGDTIGVSYLVLHPGTRGDSTVEEAIERLSKMLDRVLDGFAGQTMILLETMAGMGKEICSNFEEMRMVLQGMKDSSQIGICFDSCHLLAAGYDTATEDGIRTVLAEADEIIGKDRIKVVHANDSLKGLGSHLDRHAPIGTGYIGVEGFTHLMKNEYLRELPFILETPSDTIMEDLGVLRKIRSAIAGQQVLA